MKNNAIFFCLFLDEGKHISFKQHVKLIEEKNESYWNEEFYKWIEEKEKNVTRYAILLSLRMF